MLRILVVDDSKFLVKNLKRILESLDMDVVGMAHDGVEGLAAFKEHHPDVTLLDVTMPNMDGLQCLTEIRALDPDARVVMLSAIRDPETVERCLSGGASDFLQKPIRPGSPADLNRLTDAIEEAAAGAGKS